MVAPSPPFAERVYGWAGLPRRRCVVEAHLLQVTDQSVNGMRLAVQHIIVVPQGLVERIRCWGADDSETKIVSKLD